MSASHLSDKAEMGSIMVFLSLSLPLLVALLRVPFLDVQRTTTKTNKLFVITTCRVLTASHYAVVIQDSISSYPGLFTEFFDSTPSTFVDKSLVLRAFLRSNRSHHLILRPRRCGKTFTLSMIREFLEQPQLGAHIGDITTCKFRDTLIATDPYRHIVEKHFQRYPVLYISLKDIGGLTYDQMLAQFDKLIYDQFSDRRDLFQDGVVDQKYIESHKDVLQRPHLWSTTALRRLSEALQSAYKQGVVVLIDEYDSPMHSAIRHGYAKDASEFFAKVFCSLLKVCFPSDPAILLNRMTLQDNDTVRYCMMVGICQTPKSGWLSELNNFEVFPLGARDTRYATFFLLTEEEVRLLCKVYGSQELNFPVLQEYYSGYTARGASGPIELFNPLSVIRAFDKGQLAPYWVDTGRYSFLTQNLWRASADFRLKFNQLITQETVKLNMDVYTTYESVCTISDSGLWGLLYHTGYITVHDYSESGYTFRIPNREATLQWHQWLRDHLGNKPKTESCLLDLYDILMDGKARTFQVRLTTFLQENLSLFSVPIIGKKYTRPCVLFCFICCSRTPIVAIKSQWNKKLATADPTLLPSLGLNSIKRPSFSRLKLSHGTKRVIALGGY